MSNRVLPSREMMNEEPKIFYTKSCEERFKNIEWISSGGFNPYWNGLKWNFHFFRSISITDALANECIDYILDGILRRYTSPDILCNLAAHYFHSSICIEEDRRNRTIKISVA